MNQKLRVTALDYRVLFLLILILSCLLGAVSERLLVHLADKEAAVLVTNYLSSIKPAGIAYPDLFQYTLAGNGRLVFLLLLAGFTVLGLPLSLGAYAVFLFRSAFFVAAMARYFHVRGFWLSLACVAVPFLFTTPVLYLCTGHGYQGMQYCLTCEKRIFHMSKKQLQNFIKLGIIILLMMFLGALSEAYFSTFLLHRLLELN